MPPELFTLRSVAGDRPFAEIGDPGIVVHDHHEQTVAVAGMSGLLQWAGNDLYGPPGGNATCRFGLYRSSDLGCLALVPLADPVHDIAFPGGRLVAVASGSYDGGWFYEGDLTLVERESGTHRLLLDERREVRRVRWLDQETLELVLSPRDEQEEASVGTRALLATVSRPDWHAVAAGSIAMASLDLVPVPEPAPADGNGELPGAALEALSRGHDRPWSSRGTVWAVERTANGDVLCALDGVAVQAWAADGRLRWSVPADGVGVQLVLSGDERSVLVNVQRRGGYPGTATMLRVDLGTGSVTAELEVPFPAVVTARADGWWAVRNAHHTADGSVRLMAPDGRAAGSTDELRRYDLFNHYLAVRRAPELLFLSGMGPEPHEDKWVVAVDPASGEGGGQPRVRRLFPLEWDAGRRGHLFGGLGVYVLDAKGPAIVLGCEVHSPRGLLPGNSIVVRRALPEGQAAWTFSTDFPLAGIDVAGEVVVAAFTSGELVALRASDGRLIGRQRLTVRGQPVVPLSLAASGGWLTVGTLDGRVLCGELVVEGAGESV